MMACVLKFSILLLAVVAACGAARAASPEAQATVVIYNTSDPSSVALAKYYAKRREIPESQLVGLNAPATEEISRADFRSLIAAPVTAAFVRNGWWTMSGNRVTQSKIRYVALIRGVPLKVRSEGAAVVPRPDQPPEIGKRDEASVDSELACLGLGLTAPAGVLNNPYYRRFTPILDAAMEPGLLLVCRLDAPTEITVRAMIDSAIAAERDGLWGWGYVDSRSITTGGYAEGDRWLTNAAAQMREKGIPVLWDKAPETLPAGYPVTDAAVYYGWYAGSINGPFAEPDFRFRMGAVAVHIHSFSAATLRSPVKGWVGPLLEKGAAVSMGNVYEPYLALTANLDVFQDRLMTGFTFAESAYCSLRGLSWMSVVVGDPLYKPYAVWRAYTPGAAKSSWQRYRDIVLVADGNVVAAGAKLGAAAKETGNSMFLEALGAAQADAGDFGASLATVQAALAMDNKPLVRFRLVLEKFGILLAQQKKNEAGALLLAEKGGVSGAAQSALLSTIGLRIFPPPPAPAPSPKK
jgi:uncharacterized protein (TIGR03790 family)